MRRREFIAGLGGAAVWPVVARAQKAAVPIIGFLSGASETYAAAFEPASVKRDTSRVNRPP
jgi:hypothetical protein